MSKAWRIVKTQYGASAFDGEGARRFGGRRASKVERSRREIGPSQLTERLRAKGLLR